MFIKKRPLECFKIVKKLFRIYNVIHLVLNQCYKRHFSTLGISHKLCLFMFLLRYFGAFSLFPVSLFSILLVENYAIFFDNHFSIKNRALKMVEQLYRVRQ